MTTELDSLKAERERVIAICRRHLSSAVNAGAHHLARAILKAMGVAVNEEPEPKACESLLPKEKP